MSDCDGYTWETAELDREGGTLLAWRCLLWG